MCSILRSTYPAIVKLIWVPNLELLPFSSSNFQNVNTFCPLFQKLIEINVKLKQQTCSACQDLPTLQFWSKSHYPFWPIIQIRKKGGMKLKKKSSPQKPLGQLQPIFCGMIHGWPPSKIVSGDPDFQPRWPPS